MPFPDAQSVFVDTVTDLLDTPPQMLLDVRFAEQEAARIAADQVLVELCANARDAAVRQGQRFMTVAAEAAAGRAPSPPPRVLLDISADALVAANDGRPFDAAGYAAVRRIGRSPKAAGPDLGALGSGRGVALSMGRHGVGFRSVLSLCPRPEIHGRDETGRRFGVCFGAPRLRALAESAIAGDRDACLAALRPEERPWLEALLEPPLDLPARSLVRHARRWGLSGAEVAAGLPVLPFPLPVAPEEVPEAVSRLLSTGATSEPAAPESRPYATVVYLPFAPPLDARTLERLRAQRADAQRCFLGTRIRLQR